MQIKSLIAALAISTAMTIPCFAPAFAKTVTMTTNMAQYGGRGAYIALYLTDAQGGFAGTVWMAGGKTRYYRHLTDWSRLTGGGNIDVSAVTGPSVGSGQYATLSVDMADALFDAGYTLHMDAAAEEMRDSPAEIEVPLTTAGNGKTVPGKNYIADFTYKF